MDLQTYFINHNEIAVAFSGGVDSAYLLYAAAASGVRVKAFYVKTQFQPAFELEDAAAIARKVNSPLHVINCDILAAEGVAANGADRCYLCKRAIMGLVVKAADAEGFQLVADGTNADDDASDRPGMRAVAELGIRSPLSECGLTKARIRELSREAGLFTWDKPSYSCLATRIPAGSPITEDKLARTEAAEKYMVSIGFRNLRVRTIGDAARIQIPSDMFAEAMKQRDNIRRELSKYYSGVLLDMEARDE